MKCFLDLDGVLVDFVAAVEMRYAVTINTWHFDELLPVTRAVFWDSCDEEFWTNLEWTQDGPKILKLVEEAFGPENVCLLTSPCDTYGCREGKASWVQKHLPAYRRRTCLFSAKEFCAGPERVLIDDHDINCREFVKAGGRSILIPRKWNSMAPFLKSDTFDVLDHLQMNLQVILHNAQTRREALCSI